MRVYKVMVKVTLLCLYYPATAHTIQLRLRKYKVFDCLRK